MTTRQQERAQEAYKCVQGKDKTKEEDRKYGRVCADLPALLRQCGLCQTVTFLQAKGKEKDYIRSVLTDLGKVAGLGNNVDAISEKARTVGVVEYQRLSREALRCAEWFSRYAEALLDVKKGEGDDRA